LKLSAILAPMIAAKADHSIIMDVVLAYEAEQEQQDNPLEKQRAAARERVRRYRAKRALDDGSWFVLCARVYERDGKVCSYCGDTGGPFEIDHMTPVSQGGSNDLDNLTVACKPCNASKAGRALEDWEGRR